jgi:hypothetical protein
LHWGIDVFFNEDAFRKRESYSAQYFSMINRIALNLLKNEQSKKRSVKGKRLDAGAFVPDFYCIRLKIYKFHVILRRINHSSDGTTDNASNQRNGFPYSGRIKRRALHE